MSQLTYTIEHGKGYVGDFARSGPKRVDAARNNSGADLPFGRFVAFDAGTGTTEQAARLPNAAANKILGVSVRSESHVHATGHAPDGVADDDMFDVCVQGMVYMAPEEAVVKGDPVYVRFGAGNEANGGKNTPGMARKTADTHTAWVKKTAYSVGDRVSGAAEAGLGKVYECITQGTSEDADAGPTGTNLDITDGTVHWKYVGICDPTDRTTVILLAGARWAESGAADAVTAVEVNLP